MLKAVPNLEMTQWGFVGAAFAIGPFFGIKLFQFQVIRTIPFNQLDIEVLSVEFNLLGR